MFQRLSEFFQILVPLGSTKCASLREAGVDWDEHCGAKNSGVLRSGNPVSALWLYDREIEYV